MTPDELVGFFTGVLSAPEHIPPRRWLPEVGVGDDRFASLEETKAFLNAVMELYNEVGSALAENPSTLRLYSDLADADAVAAWCSGYVRAYRLQHELLDEEDPAWAFVFLMAVLAGEVDPAEAFDAEGSEHASAEEWLAHHREALPGYVGGLYERWLRERRGGAPPGTTVRSGPKVGRNDPCPCGSGKKFKKCCMP